MQKTFKIHIFVVEHGTDMIPVSFYCLRSQLSFDTQHLMFMHYINSHVIKCCDFFTKMTSKGHKKVKSEVAPYLKMTFVVCTNHVASFMLLSKSAQKSA